MRSLSTEAADQGPNDTVDQWSVFVLSIVEAITSYLPVASSIIIQAEQQPWRIMSSWPSGRTLIDIVAKVDLIAYQFAFKIGGLSFEAHHVVLLSFPCRIAISIEVANS